MQERIAVGHARPAHLGEPAVPDPAALGHEPGDEDRAVVGSSVDDPDVDDRVLEDPGPPAPGPRRGQRARSGASGWRCSRCRSIPTRLQANNVSLDEVMNDDRRTRSTRGCCSFSDGGFIGTGGIDRDAEPAAQHRTTGSPSAAPTTWPRCRSPPKARRVAAGCWRTWPTSRSTTSRSIGDAVINGGEGLMLIVEKLPWANTLDVTEGRRGGHRPRCSRVSPGIEVDTTIFRPATFVEHLDRQPHRGAAPRLAARGDRARALPVLLAQRADQPDHDPAVAHRIGARPVLAGHDDQHDGAGRVRHRARRGGRRRDRRHREHRAPAATAPSRAGGPRRPPG